ncbi:MAG: V4R domain-containing protein [Gemmatimonadota bacterium]
MKRYLPEPIVCVPVSALRTLAKQCARLGEPGLAGLREAGRVAGRCIFDALGWTPATLTPAAFWTALDGKLQELGLGSLDFEALDPGLGVVEWKRSPEAGDRSDTAETVGCELATGILHGALSRAAGRPVSVLEVKCGAGTGEACRFLVASESRLSAIRERVSCGTPVEAALGP